MNDDCTYWDTDGGAADVQFSVQAYWEAHWSKFPSTPPTTGELVPDWWLPTLVAEDFYAYKPAFSALGFPKRYGKCNAWVVDVVVQRHSHKGADGSMNCGGTGPDSGCPFFITVPSWDLPSAAGSYPARGQPPTVQRDCETLDWSGRTYFRNESDPQDEFSLQDFWRWRGEWDGEQCALYSVGDSTLLPTWESNVAQVLPQTIGTYEVHRYRVAQIVKVRDAWQQPAVAFAVAPPS